MFTHQPIPAIVVRTLAKLRAAGVRAVYVRPYAPCEPGVHRIVPDGSVRSGYSLICPDGRELEIV